MFDFISQMPPIAAAHYGIMVGLTGRETLKKGHSAYKNRKQRKQN